MPEYEKREYKTVTITKLHSEPKPSGKAMKCQASIDGSDPVTVACMPENVGLLVEGGEVYASYSPENDRFPASWWVNKPKAHSSGQGFKGGGARPQKNDAAIAAMSALKSAVEAHVSLGQADSNIASVLKTATVFLNWIKDNSK